MDNPYAPSSGLVDRAKAIILKPAETWPVIATEQTMIGDLITRYALPLLVIGPIAGFIGGQLFGVNMIFAKYTPSLTTGITMAIMGIVMAIISLVVIGLVTDFLADKFGGTPDRTQAFKLVVYAMTPGWVAGIFGLIPSLSALGLLASLYGLFLFYQGATPLMKVPQEKALGYTAVTVVIAVVLMWVASGVTAAVAGLTGAGMPGLSTSAGDKVEVTIPGVGTIDTSKMEEAGKQLEAAASGSAKAVDPAKLQALLPASLGAYTRTAIESNSAGGVGAQVEATYTSGDKTIRLTVIDSAGLGALAGIGSAMGAQHSREDENGYERATTVDGQLQVEEWNKTNGSGKFMRMVGGRFMVSAEGQAGSIDELKAAVNAINPGTLAGLAQ